MTVIHFSYYELSLLSFLRESHPELADDIPFVKERAEAASQAYTEAFDNGFSVAECIGIANKTLYAGLHFSRHAHVRFVERVLSRCAARSSTGNGNTAAPVCGGGLLQISDFGRLRLYPRIQCPIHGTDGLYPIKTRRRWQAITRKSIFGRI